jgi:hypothetical protein
MVVICTSSNLSLISIIIRSSARSRRLLIKSWAHTSLVLFVPTKWSRKMKRLNKHYGRGQSCWIREMKIKRSSHRRQNLLIGLITHIEKKGFFDNLNWSNHRRNWEWRLFISKLSREHLPTGILTMKLGEKWRALIIHIMNELVWVSDETDKAITKSHIVVSTFILVRNDEP